MPSVGGQSVSNLPVHAKFDTARIVEQVGDRRSRCAALCASGQVRNPALRAATKSRVASIESERPEREALPDARPRERERRASRGVSRGGAADGGLVS